MIHGNKKLTPQEVLDTIKSYTYRPSVRIIPMQRNPADYMEAGADERGNIEPQWWIDNLPEATVADEWDALWISEVVPSSLTEKGELIPLSMRIGYIDDLKNGRPTRRIVEDFLTFFLTCKEIHERNEWLRHKGSRKPVGDARHTEKAIFGHPWAAPDRLLPFLPIQLRLTLKDVAKQNA